MACYSTIGHLIYLGLISVTLNLNKTVYENVSGWGIGNEK